MRMRSNVLPLGYHLSTSFNLRISLRILTAFNVLLRNIINRLITKQMIIDLRELFVLTELQIMRFLMESDIAQ